MTIETPSFSPQLLRSKRLEKGLTQECLAYHSKLSCSAIDNYEHDRSKPLPEHWEQIWTVLSRDSVPNPDWAWQKIQDMFNYKPIVFTFEAGRCYCIKDTSGTNGTKYLYEINPMNGNHCIFRYEGKSGIHHKFREARGGWVRTYTDAQLIGKRITEVQQ